jgi:pyrroline-5-carboxylate reductase
MASAIIGGLIKRGLAPGQIQVVEPFAEQATKLQSQFGVRVMAGAQASLGSAALVVWAVKPQVFSQAAAEVRTHTPGALHLSVAAGIRSDSIARWLGSERVVRAMPNTPALIGLGITALLARPAVTAADRWIVEAVVQTTGDHLWLAQEEQLDAVTALSGSGPAYVFYFMEAMVEAGVEMGLDAAQARQLALATFVGASALAQASDEPLATLRERVTSKGGTTYAALTAMQASGVKPQFKAAMLAARQRAAELGDEFGAA